MLGSIRFRVAAVHPFIRSLKSTTFSGRRFARWPIARIQQTVATLLLLVGYVARPVTETFRDYLPAAPAAPGHTAYGSATREPNSEWVEIGRRKPRLNRSCAQRSLRSAPPWSKRKAQQSQPTRCRHR